MRDILIDGLPILDLLEVTPSTSNVAHLANCDQSSVSRIYRHVSSCLQLGFRKSNGTYRAHTNHELLASLRQATQLLRLQRGTEHLQWVGNSRNDTCLAALHDHTPLPRRWRGEQRTLELLESRVLDLAVVDLAEARLACGHETSAATDPQRGQAMALGPWSAVPLLTHPVAGGAIDAALVRREHLERPAIQGLIAALLQAYRQANGHLAAIR